jgi:hypothetical protein
MSDQVPALMHFRLRLPGSRPLRFGLLAAGVGLLILSGLLYLGDPATRRHFQYVYLAGFGFWLSLSLGALYFVLIHHLTGARWSVVLRRLAEALAMNLVLLLIMFIPILFWMPDLYIWARPGAMSGDAVLQHKAVWLNVPFFTVRAAFYFAVWIGLARWLYNRSLRQDATGDPSLLIGLRRYSAPGMILFALTLTFAAFDWFMSLDPHWYSTIFGVYYFAGCAVAIHAGLVLCALALNGDRGLGDTITIEHYHDLGKYLFGYLVFWAYIAFSQLLLIWMGNIPEESEWYIHRWENGWSAVSWVLILGYFALSFFWMLSRTVKRTPPLLALGALWVLAMHYVEMYWLVLPTLESGRLSPRWMDLVVPLAMGCIYVFWLLTILERRSLVAHRDPYLEASLAFENM